MKKRLVEKAKQVIAGVLCASCIISGDAVATKANTMGNIVEENSA